MTAKPCASRWPWKEATRRRRSARHPGSWPARSRRTIAFHYRFRVRDNLPKEYKGPHVIVYPADRWLTLQVVRRGDPLKEQEILAQRNEINRKLEAIKAALAQGETRRLQGAARDARIRRRCRPIRPNSSSNSSRTIAAVRRRCATWPRPPTPRRHCIPSPSWPARWPIRRCTQSQKALDQAPRQVVAARTRPPVRQGRRATGLRRQAARRVEEGQRQAGSGTARSGQAGDAGRPRETYWPSRPPSWPPRHPVLDPTAKPAGGEDQARASRGRRRTGAPGAAERAAEAGARTGPRRAGPADGRARPRTGAGAARSGPSGSRDRTAAQRGSLAELARKQQELAEQEAKLAQQTRQPAQAAQTTPLKPEESQRAADALKQGDSARGRQASGPGDPRSRTTGPGVRTIYQGIGRSQGSGPTTRAGGEGAATARPGGDGEERRQATVGRTPETAATGTEGHPAGGGAIVGAAQ